MELSDFKDKHLGERCFVLGGSKHLLEVDLDLIVNEISFGMNNIRLIYPFTKWRPTYYFNATKQVRLHPHWLKCANDTIRDGTISFIRANSPVIDGPNVLRFIFKHIMIDGKRAAAWSLDIAEIIAHFRMSLYSIMQLIVYMGFELVYLLGFDCDFKVGHNHFVDEYEGEFVWTEKLAEQEKCGQQIAHRWIKHYTDVLGVQVYNCSMDSLVKCWPKVRLEDVI